MTDVAADDAPSADGAVGFGHKPIIVVMGVSGSGKTTIEEEIAPLLGVPFIDSDDFHSKANIAKMTRGEPLTDDDRAPWLESIGRWLGDHRRSGAVTACSALRARYRDEIRRHAPDVLFVHLHGDRQVVTSRIAARPGHFMPTGLVDSQYDTLEELKPTENGIVVDFSLPVSQIVDRVVEHIKRSAR